MANEFIIKHGFHSDGNSQITGSLDISDSLTVNGGAVGAAFPFTGDAQITGSLIVSSSGITSIGDITASNDMLIGHTLNIGQSPYNGQYKGNINLFDSNSRPTFELKHNLNTVQNTANMTMYAGLNNPGVFLVAGPARLNYIGGGLSIGNSNIMDTTNNNATGDAKLYVVGNAQISGSVNISGSGGLSVESSGSTVFSVIGSEGDLFTITDNLTTGSLFAVKDISGIPLLDVTANSTIPDVVTVGQSNLLLDSGSLEVVGSISASGDVTGRLQRPTQEFRTNFTASAEYSGYYLRTGGNVTCSIQANALPSINSEFDFFQTSSAGNMLFETGSTSVILNSKNNNLNLAGQFSSATLKYVGNNTFDLMGDLT